MYILEMMRTGELAPYWVYLFIQGLSLGVLCFVLAKAKNRNVVIAFITGLIPLLSYLAVLYYVGIPKLEKEKNT